MIARSNYHKRKSDGFTLIELMIAISIIGVVIGLLYLYNNQGWKLYNKAFQFSLLQNDGRSALEQIAINIRQSCSDMLYTSSSFDPDVPLPQDAMPGKPYIYFAKPNFSQTSQNASIQSYDYYLYYISKTTKPKENESYLEPTKAKLKLFLVKNQSKDYTEEFSKEWPILPPILLNVNLLNSKQLNPIRDVKRIGLLSTVESQTVSPEFSIYQSEFAYDYAGPHTNLFRIKVNMFDEKTNTKVNFETAISPRN